MEESNGKKGGQPDNDNAKRGSLIRGAIRKAMAMDEAAGRNRLNNIIDKMFDQAAEGDAKARQELFDRLDGKPTQPLAGEEGPEIPHSVTVRYVGG